MQGHLPNGNPVQRHSAGEHYPYVILAVEINGRDRYYEVTGPGLVPYHFTTLGAAGIFARWCARNIPA